MARLARVAVPGYCYPITYRGDRRSRVFIETEDRDLFSAWLQRYKERYGMRIWAYCMMTNHIHLIAEPGGRYGVAGDRPFRMLDAYFC